MLSLCSGLCPLGGTLAAIRADPAPGFAALKGERYLASNCIRVEVGHAKNRNKNPVAEKAIRESTDELLNTDPTR